MTYQFHVALGRGTADYIYIQAKDLDEAWEIVTDETGLTADEIEFVGEIK